MKLKKYKKDFDYSYALGAQPTIDLLQAMPDRVRCVYVHSKFTRSSELDSLCRERGIELITDDGVFGRISEKENCYVAGVFDKFECELSGTLPHVVLVNPGDMGNLGSIIRTIAGFGVYDLALITPCADIFSPKTVRASMGAFFKIRHQHFGSFAEYAERYPSHKPFPFMLDGSLVLGRDRIEPPGLFSLVFGNEATGLDKNFADIGTSVFIPQTKDVESLNLALAVGLGVFYFMSGRGLG